VASAALLTALVAWAPLPFASVQAPARTALWAGCAVALALAAPLVARRPGRLRPVAWPALALVGLALLGWLQSLPWPPLLVRLVSPRHAELWRRAGELLAIAGPQGGVDAVGWPRLTLEAAASRQVALAAAALAAALVAAALAGRQRRHRRWLAGAVVAGSLFQVLYGVRGWLAESHLVWGVPVPGVADRLRGTFVNPNHAAYLLEIGLAVTFAAAWWALVHARREASPERRLLLLLPPALVWLALLAGLVLTGSRAGLLAALAGTAVQGVLLALPRRRWRLVPVGLAAVVAGLFLVAWLASGRGFERLLGTSVGDVTTSGRVQVAALTAGLWWRFPVTGSGLGTFEDAFASVEPADLPGSAWNHAHNDYVELAATGGLLGLGLLAAGLAGLLGRLRRVLVAGRRSEDRAAALAACGALAAVAVHEAFDFALVLPAVGLVLAVVCGAAAGTRTLPSRRGSGRRRRGRGVDVDAAGEERVAGGGVDLQQV
jgi:O-antigen ligase